MAPVAAENVDVAAFHLDLILRPQGQLCAYPVLLHEVAPGHWNRYTGWCVSVH